MRYCFFFLFLGLSLSCNQTEYSEAAEIDIPQLLSTHVDVKLSDFVDDLSYIMLESKEDSYVNRARSIIFDESIILIHDRRSKKLLQFETDGSFVKDFLRSGKGPNEFFAVTDLDINSQNEILILMNGNKIDIRDIDGNLIESIGLDVTPFSARWITDDKIVLFYPFPYYQYNDGYEICFIDRKGKDLKKALKHEVVEIEKGRGGTIKIGRNGDELYYWYHQNNTVYTVTKSLDVFPRYSFVNDKRHIPGKKFRAPNFPAMQDQRYSIEDYDEWGDYIFVQILYNREWVRGIVNFEENIFGNCIKEFNQWTAGGVQNDIDGGVPFWPGQSLGNNAMIWLSDPHRLKEHFDNNVKNKNFADSIKMKKLREETLSQIDLLSNPIIIKAEK